MEYIETLTIEKYFFFILNFGEDIWKSLLFWNYGESESGGFFGTLRKFRRAITFCN